MSTKTATKATAQDAQMDELNRELGLADESSPEDGIDADQEFFEDHSEYFATTNKGYTTRVKIGLMTFFIVEAPKDVQNNHKRALNKIKKEMQACDREREALSKINVSKIVETAEREAKLAELDAKSEALEERVSKAFDDTVRANEILIEACVRDWYHPKWPKKRPCNTGSRKKLAISIKAQLADLLMQKAVSGRAESDDFLDD